MRKGRRKKTETLQVVSIALDKSVVEYLDRIAASLGVHRNDVIRWYLGTMKVKQDGTLGM